MMLFLHYLVIYLVACQFAPFVMYFSIFKHYFLFPLNIDCCWHAIYHSTILVYSLFLYVEFHSLGTLWHVFYKT